MRRWLIPLAATAGLALPMARASAHHAVKAVYDESHPMAFSGTVKRVIWSNPHVRLFIDVKDDSGKITKWEVELSSPNGLISQGWKVDSIKPGDVVTVNGYPARNEAHLASATKITLEPK